MEIDNGKTGVSRNQSWHLVRIGVAGLLLTASALKCWQLATEPIIGNGLLDSRWLLMATVEAELLFGLWLLADIWAKPTWAVALACFGLFTCVSLCKAISGHASCGCFGRVPISPWYTSGLDLAIVFSLVQWRPKESFFTIGRVSVVLVIWLVIGVPAAFAMGSYHPAVLSDAGEIVGNGKIIVLKPETWSGKRFPLLDYIDIGEKLKEGRWFVVLYHHDCPDCQAVLSKCERLSRTLMERGESTQVALIEMPPYNDFSDSRGLKKTPYVLARLSDTKEWSVETPLQLVLQNGVAARVVTGAQGLPEM